MRNANNGTGPQGGLFVPTVLNGDAISMPGNQGGSNWGTTAADPQRGLVFVTGVNQVALLRLNDVEDPTRGGRRGGGAGGGNNPPPNMSQVARGAEGVRRILRGLPRRRSAGDDSGRAVARRRHRPHRPGEPARHRLRGPQQHAADPRRDQRGDRGDPRVPHDHEPGRVAAVAVVAAAPAMALLPPGPVVASGGAPRPPLPARYGGPFYPGVGGTTGNVPWPADVEAAKLTKRYQSGYNVMATSTKPPYTTITAYDLNTGEIKWQVPNGDDPATVDNGGKGDGPRDTGGVGARNGMVVTRTGLLFQNGKDGWARAYDVETGKVLWKGKTAGQSIGIPTMYESNGRQYVVFMSPAVAPGNVGGGGRWHERPPAAPTGPYGYIAFALPQVEAQGGVCPRSRSGTEPRET